MWAGRIRWQLGTKAISREIRRQGQGEPPGEYRRRSRRRPHHEQDRRRRHTSSWSSVPSATWNGGLKLAKAHPEISILHASGYKVAPNFSPFGARYYPGHLPDGHGRRLAVQDQETRRRRRLRHSRTDHLDQRLHPRRAVHRPDRRSLRGLGELLVRPGQGAGSRQGAAGAGLRRDLLERAGHALGHPGLPKRPGVYAFNLNSSMKKYAPTKYLGCVATDWSPFFMASVDAHLAGTFVGANGLARRGRQGASSWPTGTPTSPPTSMAKITEMRGQDRSTAASRPSPGRSPRPSGAEGWLPALPWPMDMILSMDWHVKGVTTPLPQ